jgi:hypothetical protein
MKFYSRVQKVLLERFPLLWNTHFVWLVPALIALHLIYYLIGFAMLDISLMKSQQVNSAFFTMFPFAMYIIIGLSLLIFFALRYYAHNPIRNYYPVSKGFLWKNLMVLFTYIFLYSSVYLSFEQGMKHHARLLVPEKKLLEQIDQVNLAYPFLFNEINQYHVLNRSYPKPFPLKDIRDFQTGYDSVNDIAILHGVKKEFPYITLQGTDYQFGLYKEVDIDSCHTTTEIEQIVDVSSVPNMKEYSLFNFSSLYSNYNTYNYAVPVLYQENEYQQLKSGIAETSKSYESNVAPAVHRLYETRDSAGIVAVLQQLENICAAYRIDCNLNLPKMSHAILKQDLDTEQLISVGFFDQDDFDQGIAAAVDAAATEVDGNRAVRRNIAYNYNADMVRFNSLVNSKESLESRMGYTQLFDFDFWALLYWSLAVGFILLLCKFTSLRSMLIGLVISGVVATVIACIQYVIVTGTNSDDVESYMLAGLVVLIGTTLAIGTLSILRPTVPKRISYLAFPSTVISWLAWPSLLFGFIYDITATQTKMPCNDYLTKVYPFEMQPVYFLVLILISVQVVFYLFRRLHSKAA